MVWIWILVILGLSLVCGYIGIKIQLGYWKRRGVPHFLPKWIIFDLTPIEEIYQKLKGKAPFCGIYVLGVPTVCVTNLDLVKDIAVKDFEYFEDRLAYGKAKYGTIFSSILIANGQEWKRRRKIISPLFTSKNMKMAHRKGKEAAKEFLKHMDNNKEQTDKHIDLGDVSKQYVYEMGGNIFWGSIFYLMKNQEGLKKLVNDTSIILMRATLYIMGALWFPKLSKIFKIQVTTAEVEKMAITHIHDALELKMKNSSKEEEGLCGLYMKIQMSDKSKILTDQDIPAQLLTFYIGQFDLINKGLVCAMYELAKHPDIQDRVREEIRTKLEQYDDELTYEACEEMKYLNQIVLETLRLHPFLVFLFRVCKKNYAVPGTSFIIEKGTPVLVPINAFHSDPDIYANPETFDPERFTAAAIKARHSYAFISFGFGPRICIGKRLAIIQLQLALASFLSNYRISLSPESDVTLPSDIMQKIEFLIKKGNIMLTYEKV